MAGETEGHSLEVFKRVDRKLHELGWIDLGLDDLFDSYAHYPYLDLGREIKRGVTSPLITLQAGDAGA